jgi:hypothetical protein
VSSKIDVDRHFRVGKAVEFPGNTQCRLIKSVDGCILYRRKHVSRFCAFRRSVSLAKIEFRRSSVKFDFLTRQSREMAHCTVADADWTELRRRLNLAGLPFFENENP